MNQDTFTIDAQNEEQLNAYKLISETNQSLFLTGRAGTGKTTFINYVIEHVKKNFVVLAPTGKAAMLVGGSTIHSHFGFKPGEITPHTKGSSQNMGRLVSVDAFIVDEVSMLRCDLLDAMDYSLRCALHSSLPFGGKQMIFCGDLYQLPPVVRKNNSAEVDMLETEYGTTNAFFYKAHVFDTMRLQKIEFRKVYRQKDAEFLAILDHIRTGEYVPKEVEMLNSRILNPAKKDEPYVILSGRKSQVEFINQKFLNEIDAPSFQYHADMKGQFSSNNDDLPADNPLILKVGAQVMFCKNDMCGRWVNGTLGEVTKLLDDKIVVRTDKGEEVSVEKTTWERTATRYDKSTKKLEKETIGTFAQYPIRLAWAMTIHKSQGATFDRMLLNLDKGGIFEDGQLYVALTRVRSLDGLFLSAPIHYNHIRKNDEVSHYSENFNDKEVIDRAVSIGKELYELQQKSDFDAMAKVFLRETLECLTRTDVEEAYYMTKRMMQTMISDECLYGVTVGMPECPACIPHSDWFNAIFCLYANLYAKAFSFADKEWKRTGDADMLYVKIRSLSMQGKHLEADPLFNELIESKEADAWDFKTAYALGLHNELCVNDPGLSAMQQVVVFYSKYMTGLRRFRELMRRKNRKLVMSNEITNQLALAFNSEISDDAFVESVVNSQDESQLKEFKGILRNQQL